MGNTISNLFSENINQTQLTSINQTCNQSASARVQDFDIVAIDSHVGDITISATLNVGSMDCVMGAVADQSAQTLVQNTDLNSISSLPFQANINDISNTDITNIQSFQQSIINQSCNQTAAVEIKDASLTFIDSSTGNITIAVVGSINDFSCNLQASSYQSASATVQDLASNKITVTCCGFDLAMIVPAVLGLIALVVISKLATKQQSGQQGESTADQIVKLSAEARAYRASPQSSGASRSMTAQIGKPVVL